MIGDITLGQYIPGNSIIHRSDPRTKLVLVVLYMILIFMADSFKANAIFIAFVCIAVIVTRIPIRYTLKGLKPLLFIILFTTIINMFTVPGKVVVDLGFADITFEGIYMAVKMGIRLTMLIIIASLLTLTTTPISLTDGLEKLMYPLNYIKVPVHEISMMMSIALRFIPTLLEETDKIMKAQASRGADFDTGNIIQKAKSFIPVLVPLFVSAFKRADELAEAMESRCYKGAEGRTKMKALKLSINDLILYLVTCVFIVAFILVEYQLI